jgi:hypothetical protein
MALAARTALAAQAERTSAAEPHFFDGHNPLGLDEAAVKREWLDRRRREHETAMAQRERERERAAVEGRKPLVDASLLATPSKRELFLRALHEERLRAQQQRQWMNAAAARRPSLNSDSLGDASFVGLDAVSDDDLYQALLVERAFDNDTSAAESTASSAADASHDLAHDLAHELSHEMEGMCLQARERPSARVARRAAPPLPSPLTPTLRCGRCVSRHACAHPRHLLRPRPRRSRCSGPRVCSQTHARRACHTWALCARRMTRRRRGRRAACTHR